MTERLLVARMGHRGDGIVETPAGLVYVPYALPGESITAESVAGHPDRRRLLSIETASPDRIAAICPHFGACGGCAVQHWSFEQYRAWKCSLVVDALRQVGLDAPVADLIDAHGEGRRRIVLHARWNDRAALKVGLAAPRAHHIVPIGRCPILAPGLEGAIAVASAVAEALGPLRKPLDIQVTATDAGLDVDVRGSGPLSPSRLERLVRLAERHQLARLTRHGELIVQRIAPTIEMGRATLALPPAAFLQATQQGEMVLGRLVADYVGTAKRVADLFAGVGPFALRLAERARMTALDNDAPALAALQSAALATPGLKPVETEVRDLFRHPLIESELAAFDAVLFDPPRAGAEAQARRLAASRVPVIVAASCNAATFARDARILADGGYHLTAVTPVDQFRYSAHVEIVARFVRR